MTANEFKTWKTIHLGTGPKTPGDFREALKDNEINLNHWANDILGQPAFTVATKETEIDLVKVTLAKLGFENDTNRDQICERAKELGLELCPAEVGPQLRLQYQDQPNDEWVLIGMEPIPNSDGNPNVFGMVYLVSELWFFSTWGFSNRVWSDVFQWVFCLPRK